MLYIIYYILYMYIYIYIYIYILLHIYILIDLNIYLNRSLYCYYYIIVVLEGGNQIKCCGLKEKPISCISFQYSKFKKTFLQN